MLNISVFSVTRRELGRSLAVALFVLLLVGFPFPGPRLLFGQSFASAANVLLSRVTFGERGHATLVAFERTSLVRGPRENVTADSRLELSVDGYSGNVGLGLSLRRDVYLPLVLFWALTVGAPLSRAVGDWKRRLRLKASVLVAGSTVLVLLAVAAVWTTAAWAFSRFVTGASNLGPAAAGLLDVVAQSLLLPPSHRFIVPVVLAFGLPLLFVRGNAPRETPSAARGSNDAARTQPGRGQDTVSVA